MTFPLAELFTAVELVDMLTGLPQGYLLFLLLSFFLSKIG